MCLLVFVYLLYTILAALNREVFDFIWLPFDTMLASDILYERLKPSMQSIELSRLDLLERAPDSLFGEDSKKAVNILYSLLLAEFMSVLPSNLARFDFFWASDISVTQFSLSPNQS